ncbi:uncharacterized protein LOC131930827 [Physella acuta]|uniref:uncharacterized protein LOC131930827 n=1 Tax=Physella acuta TaxID=109671 RepID=UPI0027DC6FFA|nr:uncharacterized protein LOC131930827 [Physella acuta]
MDMEVDMTENINFSKDDTLLLRPVDTNHSPSSSKDEYNDFSLGFIGPKLVNTDIDGGPLLMEVVSAVDTLSEMEYTPHSIRSKNENKDLENDLFTEIHEADEHVSKHQTVLEDFTLTELVAVRTILSENEESDNRPLEIESCEITKSQTVPENDLPEKEHDAFKKKFEKRKPSNKTVSSCRTPHDTEVSTLKKKVNRRSSHDKIVSPIVKPLDVVLSNMCDKSMNKGTKSHIPSNTFSLTSKDENFNVREDDKRGTRISKFMGYEKLPQLIIKLKRCDSLVGIKVLRLEETYNNSLQLNNSVAPVETRTRLSKGKVTDATTVKDNRDNLSTNTGVITTEKLEHTDQLAQSEEQTDLVRRRGRPRKLFKQEKPFQIPRKRGRPKKIIDNAQAEKSDDINLPIKMSKVANVYSFNEFTTLKKSGNPKSSETSSPTEACSSSEKVHSDKPFVKRKKTSSSTDTCSSSEKVHPDKLFVERKKRGRPKKIGQQHSHGLTFSKIEKNKKLFNRNASTTAVRKSKLKAKGLSRSQLVLNMTTLFNNKRMLRKSLLTQGRQLRPKSEIPKQSVDINKQKQATVTKEKTKKLNSLSPPHNPTQPILEIDRDPEVDIETVMNFEAEKSKERELLKTRRQPSRGRFASSRRQRAAEDTSPYPVSLVYVKPTILKQCDLTHPCCKKNDVSKVDQGTQWENIFSDQPVPVLYAGTFNLSSKVQVETNFVNSLPKNSAPSLQVVQVQGSHYGQKQSLSNSSMTSMQCFKIGPAKNLVNSPMSSLPKPQLEQMNSPTSSSTSPMPNSNPEVNHGVNSLRYILPKHQAMENLDFVSTQLSLPNELHQSSQVVQAGQFYTAVQVPFNMGQGTEGTQPSSVYLMPSSNVIGDTMAVSNTPAMSLAYHLQKPCVTPNINQQPSCVYLMPSSNVIGDTMALSNTPAISLGYQLQQPCATPNISQSPIHTQLLPTSRVNMNSLFHTFRYKGTRGRKSKGNRGRPAKRKIPKEVKRKESKTVPFTPNNTAESFMSTDNVTTNSSADSLMLATTSSANTTPDNFLFIDSLTANTYEDRLMPSYDSRPVADISEAGSNTINNESLQNLDAPFPDTNALVQPDSLECIFID